MAELRQWVAGARPRTLPMAVAPVLIGGAAAVAGALGNSSSVGTFHPEVNLTFGALLDSVEGIWLAVIWALALMVALALQVGVNYANDYSDGVRGTDDVRVGPLRLTASGVAAPAQVKAAAFISFSVAAVAGLIIVVLIGAWWLLAVGLVCILAAWWYTGGKNPYGYRGLGEVMVFVFFGLVATLGTTYAMDPQLQTALWVESAMGAVCTGLIASALLMVNNIRDIPTDTQAGKRTLAVRLGERGARTLYAVMVWGAVLIPVVAAWANPWFLLVLAAGLLSIRPVNLVLDRANTGPALIPGLQLTSIVGMVFAAVYAGALIPG